MAGRWGRMAVSPPEPRQGKGAARGWVAGAAILWVLLAVRAAIGLFPHSGQADHPMYGDYEAHRHWMAVTWALPAAQWYQEEDNPPSINPMKYWGIDYPPGSAYWSLLWAWPLAKVEPDLLLEPDGRGFETPSSKLAMRMTVIGSDLLVFLPAVLSFIFLHTTPALRATHAIFLGSLPALLLIDHAHFQYNSVSLGLCMLATAAASTSRLAQSMTLWHALAAACFTQAVLFKHMCIYYLPAMAGFFLGHACGLLRQDGVRKAIGYAAAICLSAFFNAVVLLSPWLRAGPEALLQLAKRLFPLYRGLYEDKVANFWCSFVLFFKIRHRITPLLCAVITLIASAPFFFFSVQSSRNRFDVKLSRHLFILALAGSALSFYLFAFQVHEKQILLPLIPMALLLEDYPLLAHWTSMTASFSMFPLLSREGSRIAYFSLVVLQLLHLDATVVGIPLQSKVAFILSGFGAMVIHLCDCFGPDFPDYPDLYVYLFTLYSCGHFVLLYVILVGEGCRLIFCQRKKRT